MKYNLSFLKIIGSTILVIFTFYISPAFAIESTKSATPSADLREKLKLLQEEVASKAAKLKQEISRKMQNKVYVGLIKAKAETSFTLSTDITGTKIVNLNEFTEYSGATKGKTKTSLKTLVEEDYIAALGDMDENDVLTARKIVKLDAQMPKKQIFYGKITSNTAKTVSLKSETNQTLNFLVDKYTTYQAGTKLVSTKSLQEGRPVVVVAEISQGEKIATSSAVPPRARFIYIFPTSSSATAN